MKAARKATRQNLGDAGESPQDVVFVSEMTL